MMIGVALEGGGARGAYHVGAVKALYEAGYVFDGFVGTSIGAINAAVLAQGDFDKLTQLWTDIEPAQLFSEPVARLMALGERIFTGDFVDVLGQIWKEIRTGGIGSGIDTDQMKALIRGLIDEQKLRASGHTFGLVAVCISELKSKQLYLEDIPVDKLVEYLMASASFPGFEPEVIDGKTYVDGGLYNNCPVNLLTGRGFDRIFAIRTRGPGVYWLPETDAEITVIEPSRDLGNVMSFDNALSRRNMLIGYLDTLRYLKGHVGKDYFIDGRDMPDFGAAMMQMDCASLDAHGDGGMFSPDLPPRRTLFERCLPEVGHHLKLDTNYTYDELGLAALESAAKRLGIGELEVMTPKALCAKICDAEVPDGLDGSDALIVALARGISQTLQA